MSDITSRLEHTLREIRTTFILLDRPMQVKLLNRLASLSNYGLGENPDFTPQLARTIRETSGVSRKALSEIIGIHEVSIYKMENNDLPFNPQKPKHQAYMRWLIENGYPPKNE